MNLSHINKNNHPVMVDVGNKAKSDRIAVAEGLISLNPETIALINENKIKKGNVLITAELAGIQAAKKCSELIPLCHNIPLTDVKVNAGIIENAVKVESKARCIDRTGVEMEALTAVSVALLTIYDMCKAVDKNMKICDIVLTSKTKS